MGVEEHRKIQNIAKKVLAHLADIISPESTEKTIAEKAKQLLVESGVSDTWYHDVPALVLLGSRSCLSISGRDYLPATETAGQKNLVTVDLSPSLNGVWGDCARSFFIEKGMCALQPEGPEFIEGMQMEQQLHQQMMDYVRPDSTFAELYLYCNNLIQDYGYENLDSRSNLGHSIEESLDNRRFIDCNGHEPLGSVRLFTFEPHIRKLGGKWGFKHENIYYFSDSGQVFAL
jgi:Xaa-Pro aminopeptidase